MTRLILVRHGNTFEADEKIVWAGARTDLPLTKAGQSQALQMGLTLKAKAVLPDRFLAGPLLRTREHAETLAQTLGFGNAIEIDEDLLEIDYGLWEGLSTEEIEARGGKAELDAWNQKAAWPTIPGWSPSPEALERNIKTLLDRFRDDRQDQTAVLVTSNGIMRFFARALAHSPEQTKVWTGHYCILDHLDGQWRYAAWNLPPDRSHQAL